MNDISSQVLYHVIAYSAKNIDVEDILYIFTSREAAVNKAIELHKRDKEGFEFLKRKNERYTKELCDKYEITDESPYDIEEEVYDLATEEEYEEYDNLGFSLNYPCYDGIRYYVYGYEIGDDGKAKSTDNFFDLREKDDE